MGSVVYGLHFRANGKPILYRGKTDLSPEAANEEMDNRTKLSMHAHGVMVHAFPEGSTDKEVTAFFKKAYIDALEEKKKLYENRLKGIDEEVAYMESEWTGGLELYAKA